MAGVRTERIWYFLIFHSGSRVALPSAQLQHPASLPTILLAHSAAIQGNGPPHRLALGSLSYSIKQVEGHSAFRVLLAMSCYFYRPMPRMTKIFCVCLRVGKTRYDQVEVNWLFGRDSQGSCQISQAAVTPTLGSVVGTDR